MFSRLPKKIGNYEIERQLAKSGCAVVYLAHPEDRRDMRVALKVAYTAQTDEGGRQMFFDLIRRESEKLQELYHPGIVRIHPLVTPYSDKVNYHERAVEMTDRPWYFVMDYLGPNDLKHNLKAIRTFPLEWKLELFYQILLVMDYLHERKYAHCDLKPDNIFLRGKPKKDEVPQPILIDFGTASSTEYLDNEPAVSLPYAPPEAIRLRFGGNRKDVDPEKMDIWSLGTIFFEIITGQEIVGRGINQQQTITYIQQRKLPMISDVVPDADHRLDVYLDMMLQPDPTRRPPVFELLEALDKFISPPPRVIDSRI